MSFYTIEISLQRLSQRANFNIVKKDRVNSDALEQPHSALEVASPARAEARSGSGLSLSARASGLVGLGRPSAFEF